MISDVSIAAGSVDITPTAALALGGYDKRGAPFTGVADRLEANVLVFRGKGSKALIVSTDLLYPGDAIRNGLLETLAVEERELFLCASHTHYAPMTAFGMPRLGVPDNEYLRFVVGQIAALIHSIDDIHAGCYASYHEGLLNHSINRRLSCSRFSRRGLIRGVGLGPNPSGARDETVRILKFCAGDEQPVAVMWNYACHASDFFDRQQVSAAYPGVVRARLRSELGEIPVLFLQGFSGNVRPPFVGISDGVKGLLRRLLRGPQFKKEPSNSQWRQWSDTLAQSVASLLVAPGRRVPIRSPISKRIKIPESKYAIGGEGDKSLFWHLIDCEGFRLVGINAEPVIEYRHLLADRFGGVPTLTAGCLDQTHCYLPTDNMIAEGGYEVDGFRPLFNFSGQFRTRVQESVIEALRAALDAPPLPHE